MTQPLTVDRRSVRPLRHDPETRPFLVIWEVTRACQLVCQHCRAESQPQAHPFQLSTAEGQRLLEDIRSFGDPPPLVVLTGGDPFMRSDLTDLVAHGHALGLHMALAPSVTPLLTRDRLAELRQAGASAVSLSLDGATAATHDGFRGVDGVFDRTIEAAAWIRELGMRLQVNTTITATTVEELPETFGIVAQLRAFLWSVFFLVGTGRGQALQPLDPDDTEDVLHLLYEAGQHIAVKTTEAPHFRRVIAQRRTGTEPPQGPLYRRLRPRMDALGGELPDRRSVRPPLDVNAGRGFAFVSHVGAVQPSGFLPVSAGSVREQPLTSLYRASRLFRVLRDPGRFSGKCGVCEYRQVCGGSRSRALAATGNVLGEDPTCAHVPKGADEATR